MQISVPTEVALALTDKYMRVINADEGRLDETTGVHYPEVVSVMRFGRSVVYDVDGYVTNGGYRIHSVTPR